MKKFTNVLFFSVVFFLMAFSIKAQESAIAFINSLNETQREKVLLEMEDQRRADWHFFPWSMFEREGVGVFELTDTQKNHLYNHLRSHLSETGFMRVKNTMSLEKVLQEMGQDPEYRNPQKYYIAFYGNPAEDKVWGWAFEGHHISLNFTIVNDKVSYTPKFFGANPAEIRTGSRKGERNFKIEEDLGLELLNSFDPEKKKLVIFSEKTFGDIVSLVDAKVDPLKPAGVKMSEMTESQKKIMWKLIDAYLSDMPAVLAKKRSKQIRDEEVGDIYFGWAGADQLGRPHYYRVQGKTFLIEFDNTQNNANHVHMVWRDFEGDFGRDLIKEHYAQNH